MLTIAGALRIYDCSDLVKNRKAGLLLTPEERIQIIRLFQPFIFSGDVQFINQLNTVADALRRTSRQNLSKLSIDMVFYKLSQIAKSIMPVQS